MPQESLTRNLQAQPRRRPISSPLGDRHVPYFVGRCKSCGSWHGDMATAIVDKDDVSLDYCGKLVPMADYAGDCPGFIHLAKHLEELEATWRAAGPDAVLALVQSDPRRYSPFLW